MVSGDHAAGPGCRERVWVGSRWAFKPSSRCQVTRRRRLRYSVRHSTTGLGHNTPPLKMVALRQPSKLYKRQDYA